jgi:hypothetical protein
MKAFLTLSLTILLVTLGSCRDKKASPSPGILSEKQMTDLLVETHLADAMLFVDDSRGGEKRDKALYYYPSILEKYGITKARMDSSVAWYIRNPEAYARIYGNVIRELDKIQSDEKKKSTSR